MTGKLLGRILLWVPLATLVGVTAWLNASWQSITNITLGILLAVVAGSSAFVLVRVVPVIWIRTGIDAWIEGRTGGNNARLLIAHAVAWTTRSWFLWLIFGAFWEVIVTPPAAFILFYVLFFPGGQYRSNAVSVILLGTVCSYAIYALCAKAYWDAAKKAAAARA